MKLDQKELPSQRRIIVVTIFLFTVAFISCEKYPEVNSIIGTYTCTVTSIYQCENRPGYLTCTDTIGVDILVEIEKYDRNSISVIIGNSSFIGTYDGVNRFEHYIGGTIFDSVTFIDDYNIYIYRKEGVMNHKNYYGKRK